MENISQIQIVAIAVSLLLFLFIMYLIRSQRLKEEYSLLWIFFSLVFIIFSFWRSGLDYISEFLGVSYPPAALFMILLMAVFLILIEFSIIISRLADKNKSLAQEIGLLKHTLKNIEQGMKNMEHGSDEDRRPKTED
jgi:hypothetical protein